MNDKIHAYRCLTLLNRISWSQTAQKNYKSKKLAKVTPHQTLFKLLLFYYCFLLFAQVWAKCSCSNLDVIVYMFHVSWLICLSTYLAMFVCPHDVLCWSKGSKSSITIWWCRCTENRLGISRVEAIRRCRSEVVKYELDALVSRQWTKCV